MIQLSELIGKELICLKTASAVGTIGNVVFDKRLRTAKYLQILNGGDTEPEVQYAELRRVKGLTSDACTVNYTSSVFCRWNRPFAGVVSPINCACFNQDGRLLGRVRDIFLEPDSKAVTTILVDETEYSPCRLLSYSDQMLILNDSGKPIRLAAPKTQRVPKVTKSEVRVKVHEAPRNAGQKIQKTAEPQKYAADLLLTDAKNETKRTGATRENDGQKHERRGDTLKATLPPPLAPPDSTDARIGLPARIPPENTEVSRSPQAKPQALNPAYAFLLGKTLSRPILSADGSIIIPEKTVITEETILQARRHEKLVHLALYAE